MKLKITNSQTELELDEYWTYNASAYKRRVTAQPKYGQSGAYTVGDGKVSSRTIRLFSNRAYKTDASYTTYLQTITGIFYDDYGPFYLVDTDRGVRTRIELESINEQWEFGKERRIIGLDINLIMLSGFFEAFLEDSVSWVNVATGNTKLITNIGRADVFPIITVTALADINEFTLTNERTQDAITIGTTAFVTNTVITIDCVNGKATLYDGITTTDIGYAVADGTGFFYFDLGDNTLRYNSLYGNVTMSIKYRPKYAF